MTDLDLARYFARHLLERGPYDNVYPSECDYCGCYAQHQTHKTDCAWPKLETEARRVLEEEKRTQNTAVIDDHDDGLFFRRQDGTAVIIKRGTTNVDIDGYSYRLEWGEKDIRMFPVRPIHLGVTLLNETEDDQ